METIIKYLGISAEQYQERVLDLWIKWTLGQAVKANDWQNLLANSAINKWFLSELAELEKDFIDDVKSFNGAELTPLDYKVIYHRCIIRIHGLYPKPLIDEAKSKQGTLAMRSNGIPVFSHLDRN